MAMAVGLMTATDVLAQWAPSTAGTSTDIHRSGAVGIGMTSTPNATLDVYNPDKYTRGLRVSRDGTVTILPAPDQQPYVYVRNKYAIGFNWEDIFSIDQDGQVGIGVKDAGGDLHIKTNTTTSLANVDRYMTLVESKSHSYPVFGVNNKGIVQVGEPETLADDEHAQLEVFGTSNTAINLTTNFVSMMRNSASSGRVLRLKGGNSATSNNTPIFQVEANGDYDENVVFRVMASGKVIVGDLDVTLPAGYGLYVDHGIITEKVKVAVKNGSEWSDFVFEDDYKLRTLAEVEEFINENKHLPGVPSADDMVDNGLNVAEMDAMLLQKIEELTLYVIELEKRLSILDSKTEDDDTEITE